MMSRQARRMAYLLLTGLMMAAALAVVGTVQAGDGMDAFELDGNWTADGGTDWSNSSPYALADAFGEKETIAAPGNSLLGTTYPYPTRDNQSAPNKADLMAAWIDAHQDADGLYLFLAAQRASGNQGGPGGNTSVIFALHRNSLSLTSGDLLVVMDFVNGGSVAVPHILRWDGVAWVSIPLASTVAQSIANPEGAQGPDGPLAANTFVEAGIHLQGLGALVGDGCFDFTQLWIMTASSQSGDATLQDVLNGGAIDLSGAGVPTSTCGTVSVTKLVEGDAPDSEWEISIAPNQDGFTSQVVKHGETIGGVRVDTDAPIAISETSVDGLDFAAAWSCSNGSSGEGESFQIAVTSLEHVECTITNTVDVLPQVAVTKTAGAPNAPTSGGEVTYTYEVENTGAVSATITALDDDQFGALSGDDDCQVGTPLSSGTSCSFQATFLLPSADVGETHVNVFTATVVDAEGNEASDEDDATVSYVAGPASISVTKSPTPGTVTAPGGDVSFAVEIRNTSEADTVVITSLTDDVYGNLDGQGTCLLEQTLEPQDVYSCAFVGSVMGEADDTHENIVSASGYSTSTDQSVSSEARATVSIAAAAPTPTATPTPTPTPTEPAPQSPPLTLAPPTEPEPEPEPTPTPTSTTPETPTVTVLGSTAQIEKELTSPDIARVGETVTFRVRLTISGDMQVSDVAVIDTFESQYLQLVSAPNDCALVEGHPGPLHSSVVCHVGDVSPGSGATPGVQIMEYDLTFEAVKSTLPGMTVNEAIASLDLDGEGPGVPVEIGPATASVEIIEVLGLQLPPTGDGSTSAGSDGYIPSLALAAMVMSVLAAVGVRRHQQR